MLFLISLIINTRTYLNIGRGLPLPNPLREVFVRLTFGRCFEFIVRTLAPTALHWSLQAIFFLLKLLVVTGFWMWSFLWQFVLASTPPSCWCDRFLMILRNVVTKSQFLALLVFLVFYSFYGSGGLFRFTSRVSGLVFYVFERIVNQISSFQPCCPVLFWGCLWAPGEHPPVTSRVLLLFSYFFLAKFWNPIYQVCFACFLIFVWCILVSFLMLKRAVFSAVSALLCGLFEVSTKKCEIHLPVVFSVYFYVFFCIFFCFLMLKRPVFSRVLVFLRGML